MDERKGAALLSFLNLLSSELGLEDFQDLKEAQQILPILIDYVKTGQLKFVDTPSFNIHNAIAQISTKTDGQNIFGSLNLDAVKQSNIPELAKLFLALIYALRISQNNRFDKLLDRLNNEDHRYLILEMVNSLDDSRRDSASSPLSHILSSQIENGKKKLGKNFSRENNLQIFSTNPIECPSTSSTSLSIISDEEATKYKIKATELDTRLKQVEALNSTLNEQIAIAQNEYSELEHKYENMRSGTARRQETIQELQTQLKEAIDESELMRYENSQLQRDLKNSNERNTKSTEKLAQELNGKESEMNLLYRRLDDYVKQLAAKETLENRVKFLDQQMSNQQGIQRELREDLERALNRANIAETELVTVKKQMKKSANNVTAAINKDNLRNDDFSADGAVTLHDELKTTMMNHSSELENNNLYPSNINTLTGSPQLADDELARLRTRLEMLECENKHLRKNIDEGKQEVDSIRSSESQCVMDKALEIERLKQEGETLREELQKSRKKEVVSREKCSTMEGENEQLKTNVQKLGESLDKAASVIEEYSTASDGHCSAAELLQTRHELIRVQAENQQLLNKMDQFKHEATQEQRLITTHWYNAHSELLRLRHGLGNSPLPSSSSASAADQQNQRIMQSSTDSGNSSSTPSTTKQQNGRSFLRRQLETSTTFTVRWMPPILVILLPLMMLLFCWRTGLSIDINI